MEDELYIVGLGSCVALYLWSPLWRVGGMAHILLASSRKAEDNKHPGRYADKAVECLWAMLEEKLHEKIKGRFLAKIAGAANMLQHIEHPQLVNIGQMTVQKVKEELQRIGVPIVSEHVGGTKGRVIRAFNRTGRMYIRIEGKDLWI